MAAYTVSARFYDLISAEPVYRPGRVAGIAALGLRPGQRVLDLACGTGLNQPLLRAGVGPSGEVVGVDLSEQMLAVAAGKGHATRLVRADITELGAQAGTGFDAAIVTYGLSLVPDWERAWAQTLAAVRPGGRLVVVDMRAPDRSLSSAIVLARLARLACRAGGSDIDAHPWTALERDCDEVSAMSLRGGHVQVRAGTRPLLPRR